ncbi:hypothetical protein DD985_08720 [Pseudomonas sp. HMWF011]|nr:hypothetical protein DBR14_07330 [Pseudomonas sp. HMWF034]PVV73805.1 hypothetical protein DD985_08720 [Pseudomonas sp. HMWF011]
MWRLTWRRLTYCLLVVWMLLMNLVLKVCDLKLAFQVVKVLQQMSLLIWRKGKLPKLRLMK